MPMESYGSPMRANPKIRIYRTDAELPRPPIKLVGTLIVAALVWGFIL